MVIFVGNPVIVIITIAGVPQAVLIPVGLVSIGLQGTIVAEVNDSIGIIVGVDAIRVEISIGIRELIYERSIAIGIDGVTGLWSAVVDR